MSTQVQVPFNGSTFTLSFPKNDTCIGKKLKRGEMWEGKAIKEELIPRFQPNTTFLDCGSFIGTHTCTMAKSNPTGDVHSFEMMPYHHELLLTNVKNNNLKNVTVHHCALSNKNGTLPLPDRDYDIPDNYGHTKVNHPSGSDLIKCSTLDSFDFKKRVSVIKIDVENHEIEVLEGALNTISMHRPFMMVEVHECKHEKFCNSKIWGKLRGLGYRLQRYYENILLYPRLNEISRPVIDHQTVFYVGLGKTGSSSIYHGFKHNRTVCHYHSFHYFNWVTGAKLKDNDELLRLISGIGYMLGFSPIVIECVRQPGNRAISAVFHNCREVEIETLMSKSDHELLYLLKQYIDEKPVHLTVKIPENIRYIVLELEKKDTWQQTLREYGLEWTPIDSNINTHHLYPGFKQRCIKILQNHLPSVAT